MKKKILITYNLPREGFAELTEDFELIFPENDSFMRAMQKRRLVGSWRMERAAQRSVHQKTIRGRFPYLH